MTSRKHILIDNYFFKESISKYDQVYFDFYSIPDTKSNINNNINNKFTDFFCSNLDIKSYIDSGITFYIMINNKNVFQIDKC